MVDQTRIRMTAEEYLDLPETNQPRQLLEGALIVSPSPSPKHQQVVGNTYLVLSQIAGDTEGQVFVVPLDVYFDQANIPQPDVIYLAPDSRCTVLERHLSGPPDLVVEVLSPTTQRDDKTTKFRLYQRSGVREYWMIEPEAGLVEVYVLEEEQYNLSGIYAAGETFTSPVLNNSTIITDDLLRL